LLTAVSVTLIGEECFLSSAAKTTQMNHLSPADIVVLVECPFWVHSTDGMSSGGIAAFWDKDGSREAAIFPVPFAARGIDSARDWVAEMRRVSYENSQAHIG
jgi:hypothetical protein